MSHLTVSTFLATTATALAPFLAVYYMPQSMQQKPMTMAAALPKPRPLGALRDVKNTTAAAGADVNLI